jgi:hypothetical protein
MIWFSNKTYATVWDVNDKGKYAEVRFSTGRKDPNNDGKYLNSTWSFVRFVSNAYKKSSDLSKKDKIIITKAGMSLEPYEDKEGKTQYPKNPALVVFDFDMNNPEPRQGDAAESSENPDDIPW